MVSKERVLSSVEVATAHVKIDGLLRLISITLAFVFWFLMAAIILFCYFYGSLTLFALEQTFQIVTAIGLSPILLVVLTWRTFEKICSIYLTAYAKKYYVH